MTNTNVQGPVALKNVAAFMAMTVKLMEREPHLPGFGVCHGPSGLGKSYASMFAQIKVKARRIEVGETWTRRTLLRQILKECGETVRKSWSAADLAELAKASLGQDATRPLIVDEADKLVDKNLIEVVRELQSEACIPVILIGEEKLPEKLLTVERMHNRVLHWFPAQPCDLEDTRALARAFIPKEIKLDDDLLEAIRQRAGGRARRIVVNLDRAAELARNGGHKLLNLKICGNFEFYTGEPPQRRDIEQFPKRSALKVVV